jgi:hypothetical protein
VDNGLLFFGLFLISVVLWEHVLLNLYLAYKSGMYPSSLSSTSNGKTVGQIQDSIELSGAWRSWNSGSIAKLRGTSHY